jgi:hypothetical protein
MSDSDEKDQVYQVDTVPPPEGEADAYNAPTRVGQMAASTIAEMLLVAGLDESAAVGQPPPSAAPRLSNEPARPTSSASVPAKPPPADLPQSHPRLNSSIPPSLSGPSLADEAMMLSESGSLVPRLHEPEEDDDEPDDSLGSEPAAASFEPLSLTPATPPVFTRGQAIAMVGVIVMAAVGTYLLFR